jgi:hypothetical protein
MSDWLRVYETAVPGRRNSYAKEQRKVKILENFPLYKE